MSWIKRWMRVTVQYFDGLSNLLVIVTGLLIVGLMFFNTYEVVMRKFFDAPTNWTMPLSQYSLLWIVSLSISYTQRRGTHIRIDAIISRAPQQMQRVVAIFVSVLALIFFILFTWSGTDYILQALEQSWNTGPVHYWPLFPILVIIPVGGFLMGLQLSINLMRHIADLSNRWQNNN